MDQTTRIDEANVKISTRDASVLGFKLNDNKKILSLPIAVASNFPNLQGFDAGDCSIKGISKRNFNGLRRLKALYLQNNQIEKISTETFTDLFELEILDLRKITNF